MKIRQKYSISGTANNGLWHHITIYASSQQIAKEYALAHFKDAKMTQIGQ